MKKSSENFPTVEQPTYRKSSAANCFSKYHTLWLLPVIVVVILASVVAYYTYTHISQIPLLELVPISSTDNQATKEDSIDFGGDSTNFSIPEDSTNYIVLDYDGVRYINITCTQEYHAVQEVGRVIPKIYDTNTTATPVSLTLLFCIFDNHILTRQLLKTLTDRQVPVKEFKIFSDSLRFIAPDAFQDVRTQLRTLSLYNTGIHAVPKNSFLQVNKLRSLRIVGHKISALKPSDFSGLSKLEDLEISGGRLEDIDNAAFEDLKDLVKLSLANNALSSSTLIPLTTVKALKTLDLSSNRLTHLFPGMFPPKLQFLNLTDNLLERIGERTFLNTPHLRFIYFSKNRLTTLPGGLFSTSQLFRPQPSTVESYDNPWICDCQLRWFKEYLETKGLLEESRARCYNRNNAPLFDHTMFCAEESSTEGVHQTTEELPSSVTSEKPSSVQQTTDDWSSTATTDDWSSTATTTKESPSTYSESMSTFTSTIVTYSTNFPPTEDPCDCSKTDTEEKLEKLLVAGAPSVVSFILGIVITACILKLKNRRLVKRPQFGKPVTRRCTPCGPPVVPRQKPNKKVSGILGRLPPVKIREIEMILQQHTKWNKKENHIRINDRSSDSSDASRRTSTISAVSSDIYLMLEEDSHRLSVNSLLSIQSDRSVSPKDCTFGTVEDQEFFNSEKDAITNVLPKKYSIAKDDQRNPVDPIANFLPWNYSSKETQEPQIDFLPKFASKKYSLGKESQRTLVDPIINFLPRKYSLGKDYRNADPTANYLQTKYSTAKENQAQPVEPNVNFPRRKYSIVREDQKPPIGYFSFKKDSSPGVPTIKVSESEPNKNPNELLGAPDFSHLHPRRISLAHRNTFIL